MISVTERFLNVCRRFNPKVIYDCGSLHALDGLHLLENLQAEELHIFECNPDNVKKCKENISAYKGKGRIFVNELAVADRDGEINFYPIDTEKTFTTHANGNPGASSLLIANPDYPNEKYVQKKIKVKCTTLDTYASSHRMSDILWMDLQGAEMMAFRGGGGVSKMQR